MIRQTIKTVYCRHSRPVATPQLYINKRLASTEKTIDTITKTIDNIATISNKSENNSDGSDKSETGSDKSETGSDSPADDPVPDSSFIGRINGRFNAFLESLTLESLTAKGREFIATVNYYNCEYGKIWKFSIHLKVFLF